MLSVLNFDAGSIHDSSSDAGSVISEETPGRGTVLYITIPVISDKDKALSMLETPVGSSLVLPGTSKKYIYSPQPSPTSADGCCRLNMRRHVTWLTVAEALAMSAVG